MASRCLRCGGKLGCTDTDCVLTPEATEDPDLPVIECVSAKYKCPICTQVLDHYNAEWVGGTPMHPLCKLAYEAAEADALPAGPKAPAVQQPPEETALVRPIILTLNFTVPMLLTPDNAVQELRAGIEDFLAGVILAYRQGEIKYNFKTAELDMVGVKRILETLTQQHLSAVQTKMKENLRDIGN